ncbi:ras GTPase-activating protein, putative, partial [Entamoeba invadens IP1]
MSKQGKDKKEVVDEGAAITYPSAQWGNIFGNYLWFVNAMSTNLEIARIFGESLPIGSQDLFSSIICEVFSEFHVIDDFIELLLKEEFQTNVLTATLFRTNSLCTKVQTAYARKECQGFMMTVFQPIIQKIINLPYALELDPLKLQSSKPGITDDQMKSEIESNLKRLEELCDEVIATLRRHLRSTPQALCTICRQIRESCFLYHTDDPDIALSLVGGFVFLRLFCPAMAAPEGMNLSGTSLVPPTARRTLILLTKILQNIANNVRETKEPWMIDSLNFVISRGPAL